MKTIRMHVLIVSIAALLVLALGLVACNNNGSNETAPETTGTVTETTTEVEETEVEVLTDPVLSESETEADSEEDTDAETVTETVTETETDTDAETTGDSESSAEEETGDKVVDMMLTNIGYDIYQYPAASHGYRYGCTYLYNEDGSVDAYFACTGRVSEELDINEWDWISYRHSEDGGTTWSDEKIILTPTRGSIDAYSICDPGVVKFGGYYYLAYTSTLNPDGMCNNIFVARSENPDGPFDKWNGSGWGGYDPQPIIRYDESYKLFGAGEPSMVVVDDVLYIYYTCDNDATPGYAGNYTMVATADATDENWPNTIQKHGVAYEKVDSTDSPDVKYIEEWGLFVGVAAGDRMTPASWLSVLVSEDGLRFERQDIVRQGTYVSLHNVGISSRPDGHIVLSEDAAKLRVIYAYGDNSWGHWNTRVQPIAFRLSDSNDMATERNRPCLGDEGGTDDGRGDRYTLMVRPSQDVYTFTTATETFDIILHRYDKYIDRTDILAGTEGVVFTVLDESIVTIDNTTFRATVHGEGTTAVDVTYDGASFRFYVTIDDTPEYTGSADELIEMFAIQDSYTIYIGERYIYRPQLRVGLRYADGSYTESYVDIDSPELIFSEDYDAGVIALKKHGVVVAQAVGETQVTITCGEFSCVVTIIVSDNPEDAYYGMEEREIIFADNLDFTRPGAETAIKTENTIVTYDSDEGALKLEATTHDPQLYIEFDSASEYMAEDYVALQFVYKADVASRNNLQIFYCVGDVRSPNEEYAAVYMFPYEGEFTCGNGANRHGYTITRDGDYFVMTINLSELSYWEGQIKAIRIDYVNNCTPGDVMYFKSVQLIPAN